MGVQYKINPFSDSYAAKLTEVANATDGYNSRLQSLANELYGGSTLTNMTEFANYAVSLAKSLPALATAIRKQGTVFADCVAAYQKAENTNSALFPAKILTVRTFPLPVGEPIEAIGLSEIGEAPQ